ncbi:restriction endonuclease subunit S [Guyparkeria hydrothermalis]|uniref:restriction endonuclease subunit S n=1 Tax=Guyparkeria hydrothermalis TaxID=923 RepID=UPI002022588F|nr:restriction endonuclease subunit S [Guyparkeria hydrothermalis]MCL7751441.1 restriction endonuclease subunit S [Guyparkeria hydrothermalis]
MSSEWPLLTLEEAGVRLIDCDHKTPKAREEGYPYVGIPQLKDGRIVLDGARLISEEDFNQWRRKAKPIDDDVILSRRCNPGESAYVPSGLEIALGQNLVLLRSDGVWVYPPFLRWVTQGPHWWSQVGKYLNVGAVFDSLKCADITKFEVFLPPIREQKKIADILGGIDHKVLLNQQINQTLEQMAQAIFKSWFVDFEPVKAKIAARERWQAHQSAQQPASPVCYAAELEPESVDPELETRMALAAMQAISGKTEAQLARLQTEHPEHYAELRATADLFPAAMQESEVGEIPAGWSCLALDEIAKYKNGLALQKYRPENEDDFLPVVKIAQLKKGYADGEEKASPNINPECIIDDGDVLFSWSGSLMVDTWCGGRAALNQHLFKVTSEKYPKWLYFHFTRHHLEEFQRIAADKAVTMGHIKREHLKRALCAIPDSDTIAAAGKSLGSMLQQQINLRLEAVTLSQLRDTLLPELLSGEFTVPQSESTATEAVDA